MPAVSLTQALILNPIANLRADAQLVGKGKFCKEEVLTRVIALFASFVILIESLGHVIGYGYHWFKILCDKESFKKGDYHWSQIRVFDSLGRASLIGVYNPEWVAEYYNPIYVSGYAIDHLDRLLAREIDFPAAAIRAFETLLAPKPFKKLIDKQPISLSKLKKVWFSLDHRFKAAFTAVFSDDSYHPESAPIRAVMGPVIYRTKDKRPGVWLTDAERATGFSPNPKTAPVASYYFKTTCEKVIKMFRTKKIDFVLYSHITTSLPKLSAGECTVKLRRSVEYRQNKVLNWGNEGYSFLDPIALCPKFIAGFIANDRDTFIAIETELKQFKDKERASFDGEFREILKNDLEALERIEVSSTLFVTRIDGESVPTEWVIDEVIK